MSMVPNRDRTRHYCEGIRKDPGAEEAASSAEDYTYYCQFLNSRTYLRRMRMANLSSGLFLPKFDECSLWRTHLFPKSLRKFFLMNLAGTLAGWPLAL